MDIDLDDAGIGRHLDHVDARIVGRRIALDVDGALFSRAAALDRGEQFEIIVELRDRRHEHADLAVARLDRQRRAHGAFNRLLLDDVLRRRLGRAAPTLDNAPPADARRIGGSGSRSPDGSCGRM